MYVEDNLVNFLIKDYKYIIPTGSNNTNFIIDNEKKNIKLKIKIELSKQIFTNQLLILLSLRGDKSTVLYDREKQKKLYDKIKNDENNINKLNKYNKETYEKYDEFEPSYISDKYKIYKDIFLNLDYEYNNIVFNKFLIDKKINDIPKIFFDNSYNKLFKSYLNKLYEKNAKNNNYKFKKLNINNKYISKPDSTKTIDYDEIVKNITTKDASNINLDNISDNIKFVLDKLIKKNIIISGKNYNIIKKIYDYNEKKKIKFSFERSKSNVNNTIDNVYVVTVTLYLLDSNKNNNIYNRKKVFCKINNEKLLDKFDKSDLSKNNIIKNIFSRKIFNNKTGGKKTIRKIYNKKKLLCNKYNKNRLSCKKHIKFKKNRIKTIKIK